MASPSNGTVYRAFNASIDEAVRAGRIDRKAQGALIAVARKVARLMDDPDWPIICKDADGKGKLDNVSPSFLLKYCEALGICPDIPRADAKRNRGELSRLRDGIKSMKMVG